MREQRIAGPRTGDLCEGAGRARVVTCVKARCIAMRRVSQISCRMADQFWVSASIVSRGKLRTPRAESPYHGPAARRPRSAECTATPEGARRGAARRGAARRGVAGRNTLSVGTIFLVRDCFTLSNWWVCSCVAV